MKTVFKFKEYILFFIGLIIFIILLFKQPGDPDYPAYLDIYTSSLFNNYIDMRIEPFYYFLNYVFASLEIDFKIFLVFIAFLLIPAKIIFIKRYSPNFILSIVIYLCTIFILYDIIMIRQGIALSFVFLSYYYLEKKKLFKYLFFILIASLFHLSAIVLILVYFISNRKYPLKFLFFIFLFIFIINFFKIEVGFAKIIIQYLHIPVFISEKIEAYSNFSGISFLSLKQLIIGMFFIFMYKSLDRTNAEIIPMINLYLFGMLFCTLLSDLGELSFRLRWYFFAYEIILIPYFLKIIYLKTKDLYIYISLIFITIIFYVYSVYMFIDTIYERGHSLYFIEGLSSVFR